MECNPFDQDIELLRHFNFQFVFFVVYFDQQVLLPPLSREVEAVQVRVDVLVPW
jgi:hypothetical protein